MSDFREWRGLPRHKGLRIVASGPKKSTAIVQTIRTVVLAITAGLTFAAFQADWSRPLPGRGTMGATSTRPAESVYAQPARHRSSTPSEPGVYAAPAEPANVDEVTVADSNVDEVTAAESDAVAGEANVSRVAFSLCSAGGGSNCVIDGDTFWMGGQKIRVADIDAPETHPPRCAEEAALGERATLRLQQLLNAGPITLQTIDRDTDQYGRSLRVVTRGGQSLGDMLVAEGLARHWEGARRPWCIA